MDVIIMANFAKPAGIPQKKTGSNQYMAQQSTSPMVLGTKPIGKLLAQYSIPAIIASVATSLYNIVDSMFIGHGVGPMAISGLAITFPLMNLVIAFCTLIAVGGATISSIYLGQKNIARATIMFSPRR